MSEERDGATVDEFRQPLLAEGAAADLCVRLLQALTPATAILLIGRQWTIATVALEVVVATVAPGAV